MYIVKLDSSYNYQDLNHKAEKLSKSPKIEYPKNRVWDSARGFLVLSYNDSDEIYAGEFAPRRWPSTELSIEPLIYYTEGRIPTGGELFIIVAGIFYEKDAADNYIDSVNFDNYQILKSKVYLGCVH